MESRRGQRRAKGDGVPKRNERDKSTRGRGQRADSHLLRMEFMPCVSRSSGIVREGDSLKDPLVQEEYRSFIDGKLKALWDQYTTRAVGYQTDAASKLQIESQTNILIMLRKLREGLLSSKRNDAFTLEVYETSLYLSVIFESSVAIPETTAILSHLTPSVYIRNSPQDPPASCGMTVVIMLLYHLNTIYPSQKLYFEHIKTIPAAVVERHPDTHNWIKSVAQALRTSDFIGFNALLRQDSLERIFSSSSNPEFLGPFHDLPKRAVCTLVSRLREKAREEAWMVVRHAYRELSSADQTRSWLDRLLALDTPSPDAAPISFDDWMVKQQQKGHIRVKEGVEGRWALCKTR